LELRASSHSTEATVHGRELAAALNPSRTRIRLSNIKPWTWFIIDFAVAYACGVLAFAISPYSDFVNSVSAVGEHVSQFSFCLGLAFFVAVIAHIAGLHELQQHKRSYKLFGYCLVVVMTALLVFMAELLLIHYLKVSRYVAVITLLTCAPAMFLMRTLLIALTIRVDHVVAFAGSSEFTARALGRNPPDPERGLATQAFVIEHGDGIDLTAWALSNGVHEIVVDLADRNAPSQVELLRAMTANLTVSTYSSFNQHYFESVPTEHINAQWIIDSQAEQSQLYKRAFKRMFDVVVALIMIVPLTPLVLLAAVFICLESKGSPFYRQTRLGLHGRPFTIWKLRSMRTDAEAEGAQWASEDDPRITRVGKYLRSSRLDEAPQLFNVLAGSMSLVGPRPERPELSQRIEQTIPYFVYRLLVKPGVTGWAQINSAYAGSESESETKLSYDLYYVKTLSFGMDLRILLRTLALFAAGSR